MMIVVSFWWLTVIVEGGIEVIVNLTNKKTLNKMMKKISDISQMVILEVIAQHIQSMVILPRPRKALLKCKIQ